MDCYNHYMITKSVYDLFQMLDESSDVHSRPQPAPQPENITLSRDELQKMISEAVKGAIDAQKTEQASDQEEEDEASGSMLDESILQTGADVSQALANTITRRMTEHMSQELLQKKRQCYQVVPGNLADTLKGTRVNPELWGAIQIGAKKKDKR